jgi:alkylated DNA nucleotide flippase Atl1
MERETINQILDLRFAKKTYEEIAATVGYTTRTVGRVLGRHRADLALMHSQWLELTNEKLQNDLRSQATHRATTLHQLREELSTRKFTDIPIDKLMRMIEQGERAMRETENQLAKIIQRGNQSTDAYVMEVDEPSFMRSLSSPVNQRAVNGLPGSAVVRAPAPTNPSIHPAPASAPESKPSPEVETREPEDYRPEDWTPEEEADLQRILAEEEEIELARQLKSTSPNISKSSAMGGNTQKKAA